LRERNILVRRWDYPRIDNYLRITIGTKDQCMMLVEALSEMV
jgi:histidinol-phosphate aminotransferase